VIAVRISEDALRDLNDGFLFYEPRSRVSVITLQFAFGLTSKG